MSRVWSDFRVKLFNQNLVFKEITCWKTGLKMGNKPRYFTFQLVLQHYVAKQLAHFCCPLIIIITKTIIIIIIIAVFSPAAAEHHG